MFLAFLLCTNATAVDTVKQTIAKKLHVYGWLIPEWTVNILFQTLNASDTVSALKATQNNVTKINVINPFRNDPITFILRPNNLLKQLAIP